MKRHGAMMALAVSLTMVILLAALFPRIYIVNDDIGFTEYLRKNTFAPWISPILVRAFCFAYQQAPDVPWYGLYQYALIVAIGALVIHTCTELVDPRPGLARNITLFGAVMFGASHAIIVVGITWTAVSLSALGTSLGAFVAHALLCHANGKPMSRLRALIYGLVFANGYMLRYQGLEGALVALGPVVALTGWRFARQRYVPRVTAVIAFIAPFFLVLAVQGHVRVADQSSYWEEFNDQRGRIHGHVAYSNLAVLAPELLERAGWSRQSYGDFIEWKFIDENEFPLDKVQRLVETGGVPQTPEPSWIYRQLREIVDDAPASVLLFLLAVVGCVTLAWSGLIERGAAVFGVGYLVLVTAAALWTAMHHRFPLRVSIAYFAVAAFGLYIYLARASAERSTRPEELRARRPVHGFVLAVIAVLTLGWARSLAVWIDRDPWPHGQELQAFEDRVAARKGFMFVHVQAGQVHHDPLRAVPRSYDGLGGGWGVFSPEWYRTIARLGVHRGSEVFGAMLDNPEAYLVASVAARDSVEDWIRRKLRNPSARLALVDAAAIADASRPELYHLVSTPLTPGSDEWRALAKLQSTLAAMLPGPPSVTDRRFNSIAFVAPFEQYVAQLRQQGGGIAVAGVDGGLRAEVSDANRDGCATPSGGVRHVGVHVPIAGLGAARFEVTLVDPESVGEFHVYARTRAGRSIHWRWERSPVERKFDFTGTFTLVPGYSAHQLELTYSTARPADVTDLYVFAAVKDGTRAGFELRHLEVAAP